MVISGVGVGLGVGGWFGCGVISASLCLFLLLLRRGEPLMRGAVTFFSGKKESNCGFMDQVQQLSKLRETVA